MAQSVVVPAGTDLSTVATAPADGALWILQGNVTNSAAIMLPTGPAGLTIRSDSTGVVRMITPTDPGSFAGSIAVLSLSDVAFAGGSAGDWGAVVADDALTVNVSGKVAFSGYATPDGLGASAVSGWGVTIRGTDGSALTLADNSGGSIGGALFSWYDASISVGAGSSVTLSGNRVGEPGGDQSAGGAIDVLGGVSISAGAGSAITLANNVAEDSVNSGGGAIFANEAVSITVGAAGSITLIGNRAGWGGAIDTWGDVAIRAGDHGMITLENNRATNASGGVISAGSGDISISVGDDSAVTVRGNSAAGDGGALNTYGAVTVSGGARSTISLSGNRVAGGAGGAVAGGGAISIDAGPGGSITLANNSSAAGGAISGGGDVMITAGAGSTITLTDNTATGVNFSRGGAIALGWGDILIGGEGVSTTLSRNTAGSNGGALFSFFGSATLTGAGTVSGNTAGSGGGAIWVGANATVNATENTTFSGNSTSGLPDPTGFGYTPGGGAIWAGANVTLNATGGDLTFIGNTANGQANAIWFENANALFGTSGGAEATFRAAQGRTIRFFDPIANNAAYGLLTVTVTGPGAVVFDGSVPATSSYNPNPWSQVYAATEVQGGVFAVQNGAVYGMLAADVDPALGQSTPTSFTVAGGAFLAGGISGAVRADSFTLAGTLDIAGTTASGHPAGTAGGGYSSFTITSDHVAFAPGSRILFNTFLNDARVQLSDTLTLNLKGGATAGTAVIVVHNSGGAGAPTQGDGIELVRTTGGSSAGAFAGVTMTNRVAAGAYEYRLFQGGVDADSDNQNWYLRSEVDCSRGAPAPECGGGGGGEAPIYRPEIIVDAAIPALAARFGLGVLGTYQERSGGARSASDPWTRSAPQETWARVFGEGGSYGRGFEGSVSDRSTAFEQHGPSYDFRSGGLQAGRDLLQRENGNGSEGRAGFYVGAGSASALVRSEIDLGFGANAGRVTMEGYSLGGYYTHTGATGGYVDAVVQGTSYAHIAAASNMTQAQVLRTQGWGVLGSLESGRAIRMGQGLVFEPQGQIVYQHLGFDGGSDAFGRIAFGASDAWYARLAGRLAQEWIQADGRKLSVFARAGVWTDFGIRAWTRFADLEGFGAQSFGTDLGGAWTQLDLGLSAQLGRDVSGFATLNWGCALSDAGHSLGGRVGLRAAW